jgi:hypothetical protein
MAEVIIILVTFCAIMFAFLYNEEKEAHNKSISKISRLEASIRERNKAFRKMRDTVYYDPFTDEITMCNRLMPVGRLENEEEN